MSRMIIIEKEQRSSDQLVHKQIQDTSSLLRIFGPHRSTYSGTECTNKSKQERIPNDRM